ncbi:hypothetical protein AB0H42_31765 [Nocardia sp. NPDC050799]|uniref:hypothetical protein n=1 Tax=Nocardia TaxID=1817 RepID=UPI0007A75558|nr:hypothetical protein [Nocardia fusca]
MTDLDKADLPRLSPPTHEHGWIVESSHRTLDGLILYVRCTDCGTRRIDLADSATPPRALSREA